MARSPALRALKTPPRRLPRLCAAPPSAERRRHHGSRAPLRRPADEIAAEQNRPRWTEFPIARSALRAPDLKKEEDPRRFAVRPPPFLVNYRSVSVFCKYCRNPLDLLDSSDPILPDSFASKPSSLYT
jgi:hypothetical protein